MFVDQLAKWLAKRFTLLVTKCYKKFSKTKCLKRIMSNVMSWINRAKGFAVIFFSSVIAFSIVEFSYRLFLEKDLKSNYTQRTMLFESGKNFVNHIGYFKYFPNQSIRSMTLYSKPQANSIEDIVIEYDYIINTNNIGLVMKGDLRTGDKVAFVAGDSFTEGQGATPWFYRLEDDYHSSPLKLVNLGIIGTGPMQWKNLASSIVKELDLKVGASVINITPDDMNRGVWTIKDRELRCLYKVDCDYNFGFQGFNFYNGHDYNDVKLAVLKSLTEKKFFNSNDHVASVKKYVKKSRVTYDIYLFLKNKFGASKNEIVIMNEKALIAMKDAVEGNFIVNVVSQKTVNSTNFDKIKYAKKLIQFLELNNINYSWCDIPLSGFHKNDGHPNSDGYEILRQCTKDALAKVIQ